MCKHCVEPQLVLWTKIAQLAMDIISSSVDHSSFREDLEEILEMAWYRQQLLDSQTMSTSIVEDHYSFIGSIATTLESIRSEKIGHSH
ncbi:MAG: hypothetical protein Sylvanvirus2_39 [Sylvanvirus sp.]|uniref:Uncharacterized protein n=1 Tax=Sylvanvirus sp. TaxID=2487774 RepID=A0A3G5AK60_9VIRU|nr:MAG: hypothetical protein Sylvanvirus2_39 [Sylvanvirus sp.]